MAKLTCIKQNIFAGNTGPTGVLGVFGSYKAGSPAYSSNLETLAGLTGWYQGLIGSCVNTSAPAIEDLNTLLHSITRQMYYLQSDFFPEYSALTLYTSGSFTSAKPSDPADNVVYCCTDNDTINQSDSSMAYWRPIFSHKVRSVTVGSGTSTYLNKDDYYVKTTGATGINYYYLPKEDKTTWGKKIIIWGEASYTMRIFAQGGSKVNNDESYDFTIEYPDLLWGSQGSITCICFKNNGWWLFKHGAY